MLKSEQKAMLAEHAKLEAAGLPEGQTTQHSVCPVCYGGGNREKSFTVSRTPVGLTYRCWRAKCGVSGGTYAAPAADWLTERPRQRKSGEWRGETTALPDDVLSELLRRWSLSEGVLSQNRVRWDEASQRIVFPIYDPWAVELGVLLRTLDPSKKPKTLIHWNDNVLPSAHFPLGDHKTAEPLWIVEDTPSAIRLARYVPSCALLGTYMTDAALGLIKQRWSNVVMALDNDATHKAIAMQKNLSLLFGNFRVQQLSKDVKDLNEEELVELINGT